MHWCLILPRVWCCGLLSFVLVCLSIDVTGALVPFLHYFGPALLFHVHAPPPCAMILNCTTTTPFTKVKRTTFLILSSWYLPSSVPFVVLWSPWCVALLGSWSRFFGASVVASLCFPGSVALLYEFGWARWFCLVVCLVWLVSLSVVAFPPPAVGPVWCPGPVFCWYLPLGIWLQL